MEQGPKLKLSRRNWGVIESRLESALAAVPDVELRTVAEFLGTLLPEFYSEPPKTDAEALEDIRRNKIAGLATVANGSQLYQRAEGRRGRHRW